MKKNFVSSFLSVRIGVVLADVFRRKDITFSFDDFFSFSYESIRGFSPLRKFAMLFIVFTMISGPIHLFAYNKRVNNLTYAPSFQIGNDIFVSPSTIFSWTVPAYSDYRTYYIAIFDDDNRNGTLEDNHYPFAIDYTTGNVVPKYPKRTYGSSSVQSALSYSFALQNLPVGHVYAFWISTVEKKYSYDNETKYYYGTFWDRFVNFKVDSTVPIVTLTSAPSGYIAANPKITWSGSDTEAGIQYYSWTVTSGASVVSSGVTTSDNVQLSGLSDRSYTFTITATDNVGNVSEARQCSFTIDTIPPLLSIDGTINPISNFSNYSVSVTETIGSGVDLDQVTYSRTVYDASSNIIEKSSFSSTKYSSGTLIDIPYETETIASGKFEWTFNAKDKVGNISPPLVITQRLFLLPPSITLPGLPDPTDDNWFTTTSSLPINAIDAMRRTHAADPSSVKVFYSTDGKDKNDESKSWTQITKESSSWDAVGYAPSDNTTYISINFPDGKRRVDVKAEDESGNKGFNSKVFNVDRVDPSLFVTINGPTPASDGVYYLKEDTRKIEIVASDETSGVKSLNCTVGSITYPLEGEPPNLSEPATQMTAGFNAIEGRHVYEFIVTDAASRYTRKEVTVLYDPHPIEPNDVTFSLTDLNTRETGRATVTTSGGIGNFSDLSLSVKPQDDGEAQPVSAKWFLNGVEMGVKSFADVNGTYLISLIPSPLALAEGEHSVSVIVTDQAGNETLLAFKFTVDRTAPAISKQWLRFDDDGGDSTNFSINPVVRDGDESKISVFQTRDSTEYSTDTTTGAGLLWEDGTKTDQNGNPVQGSFSLSAGEGPIHIAAIDEAGNKSTASFTVLRPDAPLAPALVKMVSDDYQSFSITASGASPGLVGGMTYALVYEGVGVTSLDGSAEVAGSTRKIATGNPLSWDAEALGSGGAKACATGKLGFFKAWASLTPPAISEETPIIALKRNGLPKIEQIKNSPPHFSEQGIWPEFLGSNPIVSYPVAVDPDGHTVRYRFKTIAGSTEWYSDPNEGTPPDAEEEWALRLSEGGTVFLQAWAGEEGEWSADIDEVSRTYAAEKIDFQAPTMTISAPWSTLAPWTRSSSFELISSDIGLSGLGSVTVAFTPLNEDGTPDTSSGRIEERSVLSGLTEGSRTATFSVPLPVTLSGFYRLTATVIDRAGNKRESSSNSARFDHGVPLLTSVTVNHPYDAENKRYFADSLGSISATIAASDGQSGLSEWGYQIQGGEWIWSRWLGSAVSFTPSWLSGKDISARFAVKDKVGNVSSASEWIGCRYDAEAPEFSLTVSGINAAGFVGDLKALTAAISPSTANAKWRLLSQNDDGTVTESGEKGSSQQLIDEPALWVDGKRYRIAVSVANENGVIGVRESASFTLDRTAPTATTLALVPPTDRNRSVYYRNEPFSVVCQGGLDTESPATRVVKLYQLKNGVRTDLNAVSLGNGESQVRVTWGTKSVDWTNGTFFVESIATNAAGSSKTSASVSVPIGGIGLSVYLPAYNEGTGMLALSWTAEALEGAASYRYRLWSRGTTDTPLGGEVETTGDENSALIDISSFNLGDGKALYATVASYDAHGSLLARGSSTVSIVDTSVPEIEWTLIPEAVSSGRIWSRFKAAGTASGVASAKWLVEKKTSAGEWEVLPYSTQADWRPAAGANGGELSTDLHAAVASGDFIRISVLVENGVGRAAQLTTPAIPVDDTPPPVPMVLDQGDAINHTKQILRFNWKMSERDRESGLDSYYYGWFFKGAATGPASWTKAADEELAAALDLRSAVGSIDGKTVVLAVKAVNLAGLETVGYSDGIVLDGTAPMVFEMRVYATPAKATELAGYVKVSAFSGKNVFLAIEATDGQSWVEGGEVSAYRWADSEKAWLREGAVLNISGSSAAFALPASSAGFTEGSMWRFEGAASDGAGNVSAKAISGGFVVEGSVPTVTKLQGFLDAKMVNLCWDVGETENSRWISHYAVSARWGNNTRTIVTSSRSASFVWGQGGLGLSTGDAVQFTVAAVSYTAESRNSGQSSDYQFNLIIDASPPEFDPSSSSVPMMAGATHWYDRIDGHLTYRAERGVSNLQWSAVLVPGEIALTEWQEKRWATQWDFQKTLSEIDGNSLAAWHGKQIRLRFRAANAMGIWSGTTTTEEVSIDTTDPETVAVSRASAFSNETNAVSGWTLILGDSESGILSYMAHLVPTSMVSAPNTADSYVWPETATNHSVEDHAPGSLSTISLSVPLSAGNEGSFTPLVRVRNGSGHWVARAGTPITIDRTSPTVKTLVWMGSSAQNLTLDGLNREVWVSNGPTQAFSAVSDEPVKWTLAGNWFGDQHLPVSGYAATASSTLEFGVNPDGNIYPVNITLEDRAGNTAVVESILRYNRAPLVSIRTEKLTVRPGVLVPITDLVSVSDEEGLRIGDYALTFSWAPGNGAQTQTWLGGQTPANVFGSGTEQVTSYAQSSATAQISSYTGTLIVTDRYGKATTVSLPMTVENTRLGALAVNEYWTGPFEVRGWVTIPSGKTLTLSGSETTVKAALQEGTMDGGILVQPGGTLAVLAPTANGRSEISTGFPGIYWKGIRVQGTVAGSGFDISYAERALLLEGSGTIQLSQSTLERNLIGLHLLGGHLDWSGWTIAGNTEYGVKEDGTGTYTMKNSDFNGNGVNYYRHGTTGLSIDELNGLAGNGGNREVK